MVDQVKAVEGEEVKTTPEAVVAEPAALEQEASPAGGVDADEAEYDRLFAEQVANRKLEKETGDKAPGPYDAPAAKEAATEPAAKAAEPAPAKDAAKVAEPAKEAAKVDLTARDEEIIALLPEDRREAARARFKEAERAGKLEHDLRSVSGRVSAYQKRYEELAGKRPAEVKTAVTAEQTKEWTQFASDYPDIAKAIEVKFAETAGKQDPTVQELAAYVENEQRQRFLHDAWDAVEAVHPGWQELGKSKDFQAWKASSPTYDKLASSDDIADAIALFDLYGAHRAKTAAPTPVADPKLAADAAKLAARRGAQVEGAQSQTNRASQPNTNVDLGDEDQLFEFFSSKANARLKDRYK